MVVRIAGILDTTEGRAMGLTVDGIWEARRCQGHLPGSWPGERGRGLTPQRGGEQVWGWGGIRGPSGARVGAHPLGNAAVQPYLEQQEGRDGTTGLRWKLWEIREGPGPGRGWAC